MTKIKTTIMTLTITMMTMTRTTLFFSQQPTLVRCIPGRGWVGDFYNDDYNEDDDNDVNDEDDFDKDIC